MKTQKLILKQGIIARHTEGLRRYFGWPTVCHDENGVLYAVVSRRMVHVCPFGQVCLYRSTDGGETWSDAQVIVDDHFDDRDAGICYLGNGKMIIAYFTHHLNKYLEGGIYSWWLRALPRFGTEEDKKKAVDAILATPEEERHGGSYIRVSNDYGKTWEEKVYVPVSAPHGPIQLKDGRLLYVGSPHEEVATYKRVTGDETDYSVSIIAMTSEDGGKTWKKLSDIAMPAEWEKYPGGHFYMCEPHVLERKNGHLLVAIRKGDNNQPHRREEHEVVYLSHSANGGKTWSTPEPLVNSDGNIVIGAPPHLLETANGSIVLVYSRRVAPCGNRAIISHDGGYTWGEEIILGQNWNPEDYDLGYPASTQLPNGDILTVYYQKYLLDPTPSLLYTKWNPDRQ